LHLCGRGHYRPRSPARLRFAADPESEFQVGRQFEHDEVRRGIDRLAVEQTRVKGGVRLRFIDIEQDEMRQAHRIVPFLEGSASLGRRCVRFCQQSYAGFG
jgi:hypothetical protein